MQCVFHALRFDASGADGRVICSRGAGGCTAERHFCTPRARAARARETRARAPRARARLARALLTARVLARARDARVLLTARV